MPGMLLEGELPLTFNAMVVEINSRCNARCGMCYQAAGPKGSDLVGDHQLDEDTVDSLASAAIQLPEVGRRFHISGGEAYLDTPGLLRLFQRVRALDHFEDISTTTNAYWANSRARAMDVTQASARAGVSMMEISWDHWHAPFVSADAVSNCIDACVEAGIEPHLRILSTKDHTAGEALARLRPASVEKATNIHSAPVFATGRAARDLDAHSFHDGRCGALAIEGACHSALNLTINAKGNVYPCCAGADQTEGLNFGNVHEESLADIYARMQTSPMLRVLVFCGVSTFHQLLTGAGVPLKAGYRSMCEFCYDIFSRHETTAVVRRYFDEATQHAIAEALARWSHFATRERAEQRVEAR